MVKEAILTKKKEINSKNSVFSESMFDRIVFNIAGFNFRINFYKTENINYYKDFKEKLLDKLSGFLEKKRKIKADFDIDIVSILETKTVYKKAPNAYYFQIFSFINPTKIETYYHVSFIQFSIVLREALQALLIKNEGFIVHASAVAVGRQACLFTGHSGAGKSTAMIFLKDRYQGLGDDSVIIRKEKNKFYLYQTPLYEKNWLAKDSKKYQIRSVNFLKKTKDFSIKKVDDKKSTLIRLAEQVLVSRRESREEIKQAIRFVNEFDRFNLLSFAKNKKKFINFFSKTSRG